MERSSSREEQAMKALPTCLFGRCDVAGVVADDGGYWVLARFGLLPVSILSGK